MILPLTIFLFSDKYYLNDLVDSSYKCNTYVFV